VTPSSSSSLFKVSDTAYDTTSCREPFPFVTPANTLGALGDNDEDYFFYKKKYEYRFFEGSLEVMQVGVAIKEWSNNNSKQYAINTSY